MNNFFAKNNNQQQFSHQNHHQEASKNNEAQNVKSHDTSSSCSSDTKNSNFLNDCCLFAHRDFFNIDAYHLKIIERSLQSSVEYKQMKQKQSELRLDNKKATQLLKSLKQELEMKQSQIFELTKTNQLNVDQLILFKSLVQHGSIKNNPSSNSNNFVLSSAPSNQIQTLSNVNFNNVQNGQVFNNNNNNNNMQLSSSSSSSTASSSSNGLNLACNPENQQIQQQQQQQQQQLIYLTNPNNGAQSSVFLINTSNFNNNQPNLQQSIDYNQQIQLQAHGQFNQNHLQSNEQQYIYINQNQITQQQQQVCI